MSKQRSESGQPKGRPKRRRAPQSMSAAGNCYDNAFMESCFGSIKTELAAYRTSAEAMRELSSYHRYCNAERWHSSLGCVSPTRFETQHPLEKSDTGLSRKPEAPRGPQKTSDIR